MAEEVFDGMGWMEEQPSDVEAPVEPAVVEEPSGGEGPDKDEASKASEALPEKKAKGGKKRSGKGGKRKRKKKKGGGAK